MKNLILFIYVIFLSALFNFTQAQTHKFAPVGEKALQAIMLGKPDAISSILDTQTDYIQDVNFVVNSPQQIIFQLKKFLSKHPCASLKVVNEGASEEFAFARADYTANSGERFWLTVFVKADKLSRIKISRQ